MENLRPEDYQNMSAEDTAKLLEIDEGRVKILAGQGRLRATDESEEPRYEADSVLLLMVENLTREMLAEVPGDQAGANDKIETLAVLQFQRGSLRGRNRSIAEELRKLREGQKKVLPQVKKLHKVIKKRNEDAERRQEEIREMEARLHRS